MEHNTNLQDHTKPNRSAYPQWRTCREHCAPMTESELGRRCWGAGRSWWQTWWWRPPAARRCVCWQPAGTLWTAGPMPAPWLGPSHHHHPVPEPGCVSLLWSLEPEMKMALRHDYQTKFSWPHQDQNMQHTERECRVMLNKYTLRGDYQTNFPETSPKPEQRVESDVE